jgi:hypothetical protein
MEKDNWKKVGKYEIEEIAQIISYINLLFVN